MTQILVDILLAINNRERAIILWLFILVVFALFNKKIRESFTHLIKAFFQKKLVQIYLAMSLYIVGITLLIAITGFWNANNLPTTLKWSLVVAFVMLFKLEKANETDYFENSFKDNLKVLVIVEFIINLYVFNFWVEVFLFPIMVLLSSILAFSETDKQYEILKKPLNSIFIAIGIFLIIFAGYKISSNLSKFATINNLEDFYLPIVYSITFIPFVYLVALYSNYETVFIRLGFFVEEKTVLRYAKLKTICAVKFSIKNLNNWSQYINSNWRFKSKQEVDDAILVFTKSLKK